MRQASFLTKVGSTAEERAGDTSCVIVASEPETGAMLRTKGRFYFVCEVSPAGASGAAIAREIVDLAKQEYYYDLSAGIEVSLRRALRHANRRAAQRLREQRRRITLHAACAVLVNNELYATRIGAAQIFLVRRARLFLPGEEPGELADFVHRTITREAASLGGEVDLVPAVWRQTAEAGDTLIIASGAVVDGLGADMLKNAAVTLHPRAAAEHVHNRFVADGLPGSEATLFVEIVPAPAVAATRRAPEPAPQRVEAEEVAMAESIRARVDALWRRRPRVEWLVSAAVAPAVGAVRRGVAVGLELMPRRAAALPRAAQTATRRSRRQRRLATGVALLLLSVVAGVGVIAYRDYDASRAAGEFELALVRVDREITAVRSLLDHRPPDLEAAHDRLLRATTELAAVARSPWADAARIEALRSQIASLDDRIASVVFDLSRSSAASRPGQVVGTQNGLYIADPGAGKLWRLFGDPLSARAVLDRGSRGVGTPTLVGVQGEVLYSLDDARRLWRAEGDTVVDMTPLDSGRWQGATAIALFASNLYVLDPRTGQVWKHESDAGTKFGPAIPYLAASLPTNIAVSLAVDGDVWVLTSAGEVQRFHRNPLVTTATRLDFAPRWQGDPVRPTAIQAIDPQRSIYLLDAPGRRVVQLARDGREVARFALPVTLPEPTAFYVNEATRIIYTVHGTKIAATDMSP